MGDRYRLPFGSLLNVLSRREGEGNGLLLMVDGFIGEYVIVSMWTVLMKL